MATIEIQRSFKSLLAERLGSAIFCTTGFWDNLETGTIVLLTEELADHIIRMYYNTNWDDFDFDEISMIYLPGTEFPDNLDEDALRSYIGRHIIVSFHGEPWQDIFEASAFVPGVGIDFPGRLLGLLADMMDSLRRDIGFDEIVNCLGFAALAMKADGVPDTHLGDILTMKLLEASE